MSTLARSELWGRLAEAGLVSGDIPAAHEAHSPWPVRVMLGIAGWIGALFLLGFAGFAFAMLFRSAQAALPGGVACCVAAYAIFRAAARNDFGSQFGFALSLAGQGLLLAGLILPSGRPSSAAFLVMALLEAGLAVAVPNYIHRVFTALNANFCFFIAATMMGVPALGTVVAAIGVALVWLDQVRMAERPALWPPIGYGFAIALLHLDGSLLIGAEFWKMLLPREASAPPPQFLLWAGPALAGVVFLYVAWKLRERAGIAANSTGGIAAMIAAVVVAICGLGAPGITAAILVLILGFANGNRVLMGLGLIAFAGYLSHFYYQLTSTLLIKSIVLAATGAALLGLRWAIARLLPIEASPNA